MRGPYRDVVISTYWRNSGDFMRGRPRKTLDELRQLAVFRPGRHADRIDEPKFDGEPHKPEGLDPVASNFWDVVVPQLISRRVVTSIDSAALVALCRLWSLFDASATAAQANPTDKAARFATTAYYAAWERAASKLGLNPIDRARLSVPPDDKPTGIEAFAKRKRG